MGLFLLGFIVSGQLLIIFIVDEVLTGFIYPVNILPVIIENGVSIIPPHFLEKWIDLFLQVSHGFIKA